MNLGPTWVVVADAGRARFFERRLPKSPLTELSDLAMTAPPLDAPSDRPARVHDRKGPARHAVEPRNTPRAAAASAFLNAVAQRINAGAQNQAFARLVVCAAPRALGLLRDGLTAAAKSRVVAAFDKDLTRESVQGVQQHLDNLAP
jgi:protein required for attachment to host cells